MCGGASVFSERLPSVFGVAQRNAVEKRRDVENDDDGTHAEWLDSKVELPAPCAMVAGWPEGAVYADEILLYACGRLNLFNKNRYNVRPWSA